MHTTQFIKQNTNNEEKMALQNQILEEESMVGIAVSNGYIRINTIHDDGQYVHISLYGYASAAASQEQKNPLYFKECITQSSTLSGNGTLKAICYNYIKTLEEFSSSSDV